MYKIVKLIIQVCVCVCGCVYNTEIHVQCVTKDRKNISLTTKTYRIEKIIFYSPLPFYHNIRVIITEILIIKGEDGKGHTSDIDTCAYRSGHSIFSFQLY